MIDCQRSTEQQLAHQIFRHKIKIERDITIQKLKLKERFMTRSRKAERPPIFFGGRVVLRQLFHYRCAMAKRIKST